MYTYDTMEYNETLYYHSSDSRTRSPSKSRLNLNGYRQQRVSPLSVRSCPSLPYPAAASVSLSIIIIRPTRTVDGPRIGAAQAGGAWSECTRDRFRDCHECEKPRRPAYFEPLYAPRRHARPQEGVLHPPRVSEELCGARHRICSLRNFKHEQHEFSPFHAAVRHGHYV